MSDFYNTNWDLQEAEARRRREMARRAYELDVSNIAQRGQQSLLEAQRQYAQGFQPRVTGFAQRGLGRSGLFRQAMQDYAAEQQRTIGDITRSSAEQLAGKQLEDQRAAQDLQDALDAIQRGKAQDIYNSAATLKEWAPMTGLYS
jgi:hypothetical protein